MAKAALNMLTRTSAEDLAKTHRIFMNSVDTGWINVRAFFFVLALIG
jgi:NAD(P)-dependent dehydrogenase (short-subunit alcohol dehydrogenase family)